MRIERAAKSVSSRGEAQLTIDLAVLGADDQAIGKHREYKTLPIQPTDSTLTPERRQLFTIMRRDELRRVLAASDPHFARKNNADEERAINREVLELSAELQALDDGATLENLRGAELYLVQTPNPKRSTRTASCMTRP